MLLQGEVIREKDWDQESFGRITPPTALSYAAFARLSVRMANFREGLIPIVIHSAKIHMPLGKRRVSHSINAVIPRNREGMDFVLVKFDVFRRMDGIEKCQLCARKAGAVAKSRNDEGRAF